MWDEEDVVEAARGHTLEVAEALAAVQHGPEPELTLDGVRVAADVQGRDAADVLVEELENRHLVAGFASSLQAQGVSVGPPGRPSFLDHIDSARFSRFGPRAQVFRCRVKVNGRTAGSGCLIGPSLVLTAWHVVAVGPPSRPQEPAPAISVSLADGTEEEAVVPPRFHSFCGDAEYEGTAPRADADVDGRDDVAVLLMRRPAAAHLGHVELPAAAPRTACEGLLVLVHFPEGQDEGYGFGRLAEIPHVTARWRHTITTLEGSSGGACFDRHLELIGLHQGRWDGGGRLVPLSRFLDDLRPLVEEDTAPTALWSLDGTDTGPLVIGRDLFFETIAAAAPETGRVRGLRVKRSDVTGGTTGLAFSHDLLAHVLHRRGTDSALVRVGSDELVTDLVEDLRSRAAATGLPVTDAPVPPGFSAGSSPEREARERTRLLAAAVEEAASSAGRTVWFFFDSPSVALTEDARLLLEGFVAAALLQPHLRVVVTGFETVPLPWQEFASPTAALGPGPPGLVTEYIGGFTRRALLDFLTRAHRDLRREEPDPAALAGIADVVLAPLPSVNGHHRSSDLETVVGLLRPLLQRWRKQGGGA